MTTAQNPFALLEDESAEPVVEQKQQVKKSSASAQQAKKAPLKESPASQQRTVVGVTPKPVQKKTGKPPVKEGQFEEKPEHKEGGGAAAKPKAQKKGGREFDRRSNNPKSSGNDKKDTAGKASWGNEVEAQLENAEGTAAAADEEELVAAEPEPEESYKSLADYQAEKEAARAAANVAVRKPNEGVDDSQWKKLTPLVKDDKLDDLMFAGKAPKEKEQKRKEKAAKTVLEITQTFAPAPRPERSDRGGPRGGRGESNGKPRGASGPSRGGAPKGARGGAAGARGGARGGRGGKGAGVNVMDQNAFPSLA